MSYFDRHDMVYASKDDTGDALNGVLYAAYLLSLLKLNKEPYHSLVLQRKIEIYADKVFANGKFWQGVEKIGIDTGSHDDVTGIVSTIMQNGIIYKFRGIKISHFWYRTEIFLYAHWLKKFYSPLFLWIYQSKAIVSCMFNSKSPNGVLHTDGELLAWLVFKSFNFRITEKICTYFLEKRFGKKWLSKLFAIKFSDPNHPINIQARIYDEAN